MTNEKYLKFCNDIIEKTDKETAVYGFNSLTTYPMAEPVGTLKHAELYFNPEPGKKILDIGCGYGRFLFECEDAGLVTFGIDISKNLIDLGKQIAAGTGSNTVFRNTDISDADFTDNFFDYIWCYQVTCYLNKNQILEIISQSLRWIKPGGKIFIEFKNKFHILSLISMFLKVISNNITGGFRNPISVFEVSRFLKKSRVKYFEFYPESMILFPLYLPVRGGSLTRIITEGVPGKKQIRFIPILPEFCIKLLNHFFLKLRNFSKYFNNLFSFFSKEFIVVITGEDANE